MLKFANVSQNSPGTKIELHSFNIHELALAWSAVPINIEMFLQREPPGTGGFRQAFKANSSTPTLRFSDSTWVVKKYLEKAVQGINDLEQHTKKQVQMRLLAKNFCEQLRKKITQRMLLMNLERA